MRSASLAARTALAASALLAATFLAAGCGSIRLDRPLTPTPASDAPRPPLVRVWERDVDAAFGPAPALVVGGHVAVGTLTGAVLVLDGATGRSAGKLSFGASIGGGLAVSPDGRTLVVPVARGRASVVAHDLRGGERRWAWRPDSTAQTADAGLVLVAGVVVAPLHDGTVVGLDADTGAERWRVAGTPPAQNHAAPALLPGGLVAVADDRGTVRALDAATGAVRWTATVGAPVYASLLESGGCLLVVLSEPRHVTVFQTTGASAPLAPRP